MLSELQWKQQNDYGLKMWSAKCQSDISSTARDFVFIVTVFCDNIFVNTVSLLHSKFRACM